MSFLAKKFKKLPLLGILRGVDLDDAVSLLEAIEGSGLKTVEITMNTPGAEKIIGKMKKIAGKDIAIGAGTVLSGVDCKKATDSGAEFIVMPCLVPSVAKFCRNSKIPFFPGALTPQEVLNAWDAGASMVKIFPAEAFGPSYIKQLKGPYDKIKMMAVGGVNLGNIGEYFGAGADAVAFGASVFKKEWLEKKDFKSIGKLIKEYVQAVERTI
ncbi:MAG: bifunctional 4-hydroxy-2-oxoglutarate aldolase/2-dehydro-3-deoxy-phosphogluconate aldolase [Candidatus Omnitrophica bacterium]|nr:bifunctional 4-hydroxy-2-oxoglutarate aldolase/2-dehydro-3-deoxy-phosphogluconate aldolase [Candidatus Omnitrophota bacterium]